MDGHMEKLYFPSEMIISADADKSSDAEISTSTGEKNLSLPEQNTALSIKCQDFSFFGASAYTQLSYFFKNPELFLKKMTTLIEGFGIKEIEVVGAPRLWQRYIKNVSFRKHTVYSKYSATSISLAELFELSESLEGRKTAAKMLVNVLLQGEKSVTLYVPPGQTMEELINHIPGFQDIMGDSYFITNPYSSLEFTKTDTVTPVMGNLLFSKVKKYLVFQGETPVLMEGDKPTAQPCTNCLECARVCPSGIYPSILHHTLAGGEEKDARDAGLERCVKCGRCTSVCPASIELAKTIIYGLEKDESNE